MVEFRIPRRIPLLLFASLVAVVPWLTSLAIVIGPAGAGLSRAEAQVPAVALERQLGRADIERAVEVIRDLSAFFTELAENDSNRHAAEIWIVGRDYYTMVAQALSDLLDRDRVRIDDLSGGIDGRVESGVIVLDRRLGDRWQAHLAPSTRRSGGDDWRFINQLSSTLHQALRNLGPDIGRDWFSGHERRSSFAGLPPESGGDELAQHLSRFWFLKDKHLWLSMRAGAAEDPARRRVEQARQLELLSEFRAASEELERDLGQDWAGRLTLDWQEYGRLVRRFSANRNWLTTAGAPETGGDTGPSPAELTAELETSRAETARLEEKLATALETGRQEIARLEGELAAQREANRQAVAETERRLRAELEASHTRATSLEAQFVAEREADRKALAALEQRMSAELEASRREAARQQARLSSELKVAQEGAGRLAERMSAELEVTRAEAAQLRAQLAELRAKPLSEPPDPGAPATPPSNRTAWLPGFALAMLLLLVIMVVVIVQRRRAKFPPDTKTVARPGVEEIGGAAGSQEFAAEPPEPATPQRVVEALRQGDLPLFEQRLSALAGLPPAQLQRIVYGAGGENLAIICRGLGMDKLVFTSIFLLSQRSRPEETQLGPRDLSRVIAYFDRLTEDSAKEVLRNWQRDPGLPGVIERLKDATRTTTPRREPGAAE